MSRPKHYWYGAVKRMIMISPKLRADESKQAQIMLSAISEARDETKELPNGDLRLKAVDDILIKKTRTYEGVAQDVHYEARTVQGWISSFVNLVGRKAGY